MGWDFSELRNIFLILTLIYLEYKKVLKIFSSQMGCLLPIQCLKDRH